jgi:hypothetical protein
MLGKVQTALGHVNLLVSESPLTISLPSSSLPVFFRCPHSGQAPALVNAVSTCLQHLHTISSSSSSSSAVTKQAAVLLPQLAAPLAAVLDALSVDLTTAAAVAAAAERLLAALGGSWQPLLVSAAAAAAAAAAAGGGGGAGVLGAGGVSVVLRMYVAVLR